MYNNTFEARFLTSKNLPKGAFFGRKQWRHTAVSVRPHRGATEFSPLELIPKTRWKDVCKRDMHTVGLREGDTGDSAYWKEMINNHSGDPR